jgi:hypothetical protein
VTDQQEKEERAPEQSEQPYQFQLCGDYWVVRFTTDAGTKEGHFLDLEGFRHIAKLMAHPDKPIEAISLQGLGDSPVAHEAMKPQFASDVEERQAIEKLKADLEQQMAHAADPAKKAELQEEYKRLLAIERDSKKRRLGPPSPREKARKAVTNAITRAMRRIRPTMPNFAKFLERSIRPAGTAFMYSPAPPAPRWVL